MSGMIRPLITVLCIGLVAPLPQVQAQEGARPAQQRELERLRQRIEQARGERQRLREEQQALQQEAARISRDLVRLAAKAQALEQRVEKAQRRIRLLQERRGELRARLARNRAAIARLLAALQRLRRDPPPPFVTRPDDMLSAVRGALVMGAVLPRMNERAQRLRDDLERLSRLDRQLRQEREEHRKSLSALRQTTASLQGMLKLKRELLSRTRQRLAAQDERLRRLLKQAATLNELVRAVEKERQRQSPTPPQAEAAATPPKAEETGRATAGKGGGKPGRSLARLAPAPPFPSLRGRLPWPAQGRKVADFGQRTKLLGTATGLYLSTLPRAVITAPARARVLLAGNFRGYGKLVILDVGQGYRILLAGLASVSVHAGETVRAGEPVGRMGEHPAPSTITDEGVARTRPILYMELRKGRKLLDPSGWFIRGRRQARRN